MIERRGDVFSSEADALGHGVNTAGVMGAGVAKVFRSRWPAMFDVYRDACRSQVLVAGGMLPWQEPGGGRWVYNLASQDRPGAHARLGWVESAAAAALLHASEQGVGTVALPRIGCGIGGLVWADVAAVLASVERQAGPQFEVWTLPAR